MRTNADDLERMDMLPMLARHLRNAADAIDAHLATPAQAVDVEAVREVIANLRRESALLAHDMDSQTYLLEQANKLSQSIGDKTRG
jgi:hypothetical protein